MTAQVILPAECNNNAIARDTRWSLFTTARYRWRSFFVIRIPPSMAESSQVQVPSDRTRIVRLGLCLHPEDLLSIGAGGI